MSRALSIGYWKWVKHVWSDPLCLFFFVIQPAIRMIQQPDPLAMFILPLAWFFLPWAAMWDAHFNELEGVSQS